MAGPGDLQRAPADQPGAQQRRRLRGVAIVGEAHGECGLGDDVGGVAAVAVVAGEGWIVAQVLAPLATIGAVTAGASEPGDANPCADGEALDLRARLRHPANDLVTGHDRRPHVGQFAVDEMQVGAADAARLDADQEFRRARLGIGALLHDQRRADPPENHRPHGALLNATSGSARSADAAGRG